MIPNSLRSLKIGKNRIVHKNSKFTGSLVIYEITENLNGTDKSWGDLLDPDYHHASAWAATCDKDFFQIQDYCQTDTWGNVGHTAYALLEKSLPKLKIEKILEATHNDWENSRPQSEPSSEEKAWLTSQT